MDYADLIRLKTLASQFHSMLKTYQHSKHHTGVPFDLYAAYSLERCYLLGEYLRHSGYDQSECLTIVQDGQKLTWLHQSSVAIDLRFGADPTKTEGDAVNVFPFSKVTVEVIDTCIAGWRHLPVDEWEVYHRLYLALLTQ